MTEIKFLGFDCSLCKFAESLPNGGSIISTLDLESCFFENVSENTFSAFQSFLAELDDRKVLWLTRPSLTLCNDPRSAQTIAIARSIRSELSMYFVTLEIDPKEKEFAKLVMQIFGNITREEYNDILKPDMEYAVDDGVIKAGR